MLQTSNTSDVCISHCSVLQQIFGWKMEFQGEGARWRWGVEGNRRAGDGGMEGDGDVTRHGNTAVDGPHVGARSFYSHRIDGPVGRGGIQTLCGRASGR